jgi:hypothetical protein
MPSGRRSPIVSPRSSRQRPRRLRRRRDDRQRPLTGADHRGAMANEAGQPRPPLDPEGPRFCQSAACPVDGGRSWRRARALDTSAPTRADHAATIDTNAPHRRLLLHARDTSATSLDRRTRGSGKYSGVNAVMARRRHSLSCVPPPHVTSPRVPSDTGTRAGVTTSAADPRAGPGSSDLNLGHEVVAEPCYCPNQQLRPMSGRSRSVPSSLPPTGRKFCS